jgi:H+-transporting ATPase
MPLVAAAPAAPVTAVQAKLPANVESAAPPAGPAHDEKKNDEEPCSVEFQEAPHDGLTTAQAEALLKQWGPNSLPEKHTPKWLIFLRLLIGPMPIMLWIASLIELIIGNYADMAILLVIQFVNAFISFYETTKAGDAVAALKKSLKPTATCKRNGKWADMDATTLVPGDMVLLAAGSAIPADCYVNCGLIEVDQSAMTGESLPVKFRRGDICKLGSTVVRGETEGTVESTGAHTFFGKTATMLQASGSEMGSLQVLLLRIMLILVALSLTLCITALIFLVVEGRKSNAKRTLIHQKDDAEIVKGLRKQLPLQMNPIQFISNPLENLKVYLLEGFGNRVAVFCCGCADCLDSPCN